MSQYNFSTLPKNQAFLDYLKSKKHLKVISNTKLGHPLGAIPPIISLPKYESTLNKDITFPVKYDLRSEDKVTSVKNQDSLGTCWSFATYGSLESNLLPNETTDFSENNLINNHGFDWTQNEGGNHNMSSAYLTRWSGPMDEKDDPYTGKVHPSPSNIFPIKHVQEIRLLPQRQNANDNDNIKYALINHGAIFAYMFWDDNYYNSNSTAYYYDIAGTNINHAITIVGWDNSYSSANFTIPPPGNGAFIIKNSWGTNWGESGYFYISYYDQCLDASSVYTIAEEVNNFKDIYQYDLLGFLAGIGYTDSRSIWMANIFTATSNNPIAAVSFYTLFPSTECTIEIYTDSLTSPISGNLSTSKSFTSNIIGYQTVHLDNPIPITIGTKFSITVNLTVPQGSTSSVAVEEKIDGYSNAVSINPGESFVSTDKSSWVDLSDFPPYGNICLKAFTSIITPNTIVSFDPLIKTVGKRPTSEYSDDFIVKVIIKALPTGQSVLGSHNTVSFDTDFLQLVKCEVSTDCLLNPIIGEPIIDITSGTIDFNLARSVTSYPRSDGAVYDITLKAKTKGTTSLKHIIADLRDDEGNVIPVTTEDITINIVDIIGLIGDFNYDNKIDFEDLLLFAKAFNHKSGDIGWENTIPTLFGTPYKVKDIGPASGTIPNLSITPDNIIDINDYSIFVQMWKWIRTQNMI